MHAAVVSAFDQPPRYAAFADPVAAEGEVPVTVTAAGLHPIVKALASGTHYASTGELPAVPGIDGVGRLSDGSRVYFGMARSPYGTFAERSLAASWMCIPLPEAPSETISDATAAGIVNPAMSSWMALTARAQFVAGESVLILGATGVAGQLAVQIAKSMGARRVIAAGRNPQVLESLKNRGADAVVSLDQTPGELVATFRREYAVEVVDIVLDYLWGQPAEALLQAITQRGLSKKAGRLRFIQIGDSAGKSISLPSSVLRSSGLELLGSGLGSASLDQIRIAVTEFFKTASVRPYHFSVKTAPLSEVEALWNAPEQGTRLVFQP